jgi:hypothetical protein
MNKAVKKQTPAGASAFCVSHRVAEDWSLKHLIRAGSIFGTCCLLGLLSGGFSAQGAVNVTQHHNNPRATVFISIPPSRPRSPPGLTRDKAFNGSIIGDVYAQPLYIEGGPRGGRSSLP